MFTANVVLITSISLFQEKHAKLASQDIDIELMFHECQLCCVLFSKDMLVTSYACHKSPFDT